MSEPELNWRALPGVHEEVICPHCDRKHDLWAAIMDLNDEEEWTREQIADWLDTLDIDLEFKVESTKV